MQPPYSIWQGHRPSQLSKATALLHYTRFFIFFFELQSIRCYIALRSCITNACLIVCTLNSIHTFNNLVYSIVTFKVMIIDGLLFDNVSRTYIQRRIRLEAYLKSWSFPANSISVFSLVLYFRVRRLNNLNLPASKLWRKESANISSLLIIFKRYFYIFPIVKFIISEEL